MPGRNPNQPTREQLYLDYVVLQIPVAELLQRYGYAHNSTIYRLLEKYNIPRRGMPVKPVQKQHFTSRQIQIVAGCILGDGYVTIPKGCRWPNLQVEQCLAQRDYAEWKRRELLPFSASRLSERPPYATCIVGVPTMGHGSVRFRTCVHPDLAPLHKLFYGAGQKSVNEDGLDLLGELGLAVWIMDDGCYHKRHKELLLATGAFTEQEQQVMQDWFARRYNLHSRLEYQRRGRYVLVFCTRSAHALADLVKPFILPSLAYKIGC